jgi:lambda repressor-like predicted transcriptional regulator
VIPTNPSPLALKCWAEIRRRKLSVRKLARTAGYDEGTIRKLLRGLPMRYRETVARDVWEALERTP